MVSVQIKPPRQTIYLFFTGWGQAVDINRAVTYLLVSLPRSAAQIRSTTLPPSTNVRAVPTTAQHGGLLDDN